MAEKVTVMVLNVVDLQCPSCHKKIKKILCKIPQIRDQIFDAKKNTVTINVVCCSPEKIRDKLCCKGRKVIKSIEIKEPKKIDPPPPPPPPPAPPAPAPPAPPMKELQLVLLHPSGRTCCGPCSEGDVGGPCYHGYPYPPSRNYSCYGYWCRCGCGRGGYWCRCGCGRDGYGCGCGCGCGRGRGCHMGMCVCYIEETPSAECKVM